MREPEIASRSVEGPLAKVQRQDCAGCILVAQEGTMAHTYGRMFAHVILAGSAAGILMSVASAQQSSRLEFDVVSIKASKLLGGAVPIGSGPIVGSLTLTGVTPKTLIERAYSIKPAQVLGPARINEEFYDIVAKTARPYSVSEQKLMIQTMLADRFQLIVHRETRELQVYELVVGTRGPKIHEAPPDSVGPRLYPNFPGISVRGASMSRFAELLSTKVDCPVLDKTGLSGSFDLNLEWTAESVDPDVEPGPSLFTAIQEQLGLKLQARKAPIEVVVVDRIARPSAN